MNPLQNTKWLNSVPPAAIKDNASYTCTEIDTLGYDYATIAVILGATDIAMSACKITSSDTASGASAGDDVTGLIYGTSTNIAGSTSSLPSATDDNKIFIFEIDLRYQKRYLNATLTWGDGTAGGYANVITILSKAKEAGTTATLRGLADVLRV